MPNSSLPLPTNNVQYAIAGIVILVIIGVAGIIELNSKGG